MVTYDHPLLSASPPWGTAPHRRLWQQTARCWGHSGARGHSWAPLGGWKVQWTPKGQVSGGGQRRRGMRSETLGQGQSSHGWSARLQSAGGTCSGSGEPSNKHQRWGHSVNIMLDQVYVPDCDHFKVVQWHTSRSSGSKLLRPVCRARMKNKTGATKPNRLSSSSVDPEQTEMGQHVKVQEHSKLALNQYQYDNEWNYITFSITFSIYLYYLQYRGKYTVDF